MDETAHTEKTLDDTSFIAGTGVCHGTVGGGNSAHWKQCRHGGGKMGG